MFLLHEIPPAKNNMKKKNPSQKQQRANPAFRKDPPGVRNSGKGTTRIKGSARVGTLDGDSHVAVFLDYLAFKLSTEVPVLAKNCELFERYFVHSMELEFVPTVPVTTPGTVHMAPEYDPLDEIQSSAVLMARNLGYRSAPVSSRLRCPMPNMKQPDGSYLRPDMYTSPTNNDRLVQYGSFNVMCDGVGASSVVGQLILHYDVTFSRPQARASGFTSTALPGKLIRDGTGGLYSQGSDTVGATVLGGILSQTSGGASQALETNKTYTAIVDEMQAGISLVTSVGASLAEGARIFFKGASNEVNAAATTTTQAASEWIGKMATSRTFDPNTVISMTTNGVNGIILRNVAALGGYT